MRVEPVTHDLMSRNPRGSDASKPCLTIVLVALAVSAGSLVGAGRAQTVAPVPPLVTVAADVASARLQSATYGLVARNAGSARAEAVRLALTVPAGTTFESSDPPPSAGACDNGGAREPAGTECSWDVGGLDPGAEASVEAVLNLAPDLGTFTVSATARASYAGSTASVSDTDSSLKGLRVVTEDDTYVDRSEVEGANHGSCATLRVGAGDRLVAYVESDSGLPAEESLEQVWAARVEATVQFTDHSPAAAGSLALHRIVTDEWGEGSGACSPPGSGSGSDARTGSAPGAASEPAAVVPVSAAGERVAWDVSAELDTIADRRSFQGWAVRDGSDAETGLESGEGAAANAPALRLVYTEREAATCVDADPESATAHSRDLHTVTATATDGTKVATTSDDGCNGTPVTGTNIQWTVEKDTPDVFIATLDGAATERTSGPGGAAGPDTASATTRASGRTSAGLRLSGPEAPDPSNRVSARLEGSADAMEPGADPRCALPPPAALDCSGESATEDDVTVTWSAAATPATSSSGPAPSSSSPSAGTSSAPATSSPSSSPSPTRPPGARRDVTLSSSATRVDAGRTVRLSGRVTTSEPRCRISGVTVFLRRRVFGTKRYGPFGETSTDAAGRFELTLPIRSSADLAAVVEAYEGCAGATSSPVPVEARGRVSRRVDVDRGAALLTVSGTVRPHHRRGTVVLEWLRRGRRRESLTRARLRRSSTFRLTVAIDWRGTRTLRVRWISPHADHADGAGKSFRVRGR